MKKGKRYIILIALKKIRNAKRRNYFARMLAFLVDTIVVGAVAYLFIFSVLDIESICKTGFTFAFMNCLFFFYILYFIFFDWKNSGRSLGKMLMGIKLMPVSSSEVYRNDLFCRSVMKVSCIYFLPVTIVYFLIKGKIPHELLFKQSTVKA